MPPLDEFREVCIVCVSNVPKRDPFDEADTVQVGQRRAVAPHLPYHRPNAAATT